MKRLLLCVVLLAMLTPAAARAQSQEEFELPELSFGAAVGYNWTWASPLQDDLMIKVVLIAMVMQVWALEVNFAIWSLGADTEMWDFPVTVGMLYYLHAFRSRTLLPYLGFGAGIFFVNAMSEYLSDTKFGFYAKVGLVIATCYFLELQYSRIMHNDTNSVAVMFGVRF